jgi:hypothetical protein
MNVIVVSYIGSPWLQDCLNSLKDCKYPIIVVTNTKEHNHYESYGIHVGYKLGKEFFLMHDSCIIKDLSFLDKMANTPGEYSFSSDFFMCIGKYSPKPNVNIPELSSSKQDAVDFESNWCKNLYITTKAPAIDVTFRDTNIFEEKHGKTRMVLENQYMKKWKNCWNPSMIPTADRVQ